MRQLNMFIQDKINKHQSELNSYDLKWLWDESKDDACEILTALAEADIYPYSVFKDLKEVDEVWKELLLIDPYGIDCYCDYYINKSLIKGNKGLQAFCKIAFSLGLHIFYIKHNINTLWWTSDPNEDPSGLALSLAKGGDDNLQFPDQVGLPGDDWSDYGLDLSSYYDDDGEWDWDRGSERILDFLDYGGVDCDEITCSSEVISDPNQKIKIPGPVKC